MISDWATITINALQNLWVGFLTYIGNIIGALLVFIIGWLIAVGIGKLISEILKKTQINQFFESTGWQNVFHKAEIKMNIAEFIGAIFKWILVIVFLSASLEILGLTEFVLILHSIINWLPNLIVAIAIFIVAIIIADISEKITRATIEKMNLGFSEFLGTVVKWAIYIFSIFAILFQMGVMREFLVPLFVGFIATLTLALGLAFGLGGKDAAAKLIEDIRNKITKK